MRSNLEPKQSGSSIQVVLHYALTPSITGQEATSLTLDSSSEHRTKPGVLVPFANHKLMLYILVDEQCKEDYYSGKETDMVVHLSIPK